mmetsp:Transcript_107808/g.310499  ORF Transcript_107808/g.310499 Transcript_107808/m.310499 type:complete len:158 (-) Transcript_107808:193-666(-)
MAGTSAHVLALVVAAVAVAMGLLVAVVVWLSRLVRNSREVDVCPAPCALAVDFLQAAARGDAVVCAHQLEVHPNFADARNFRGQSALHLAASAGHCDTCKELIAARADVEATDLTGNTPLSYAAKAKHYTVCSLLLEHGADIESADCVARDISCAIS